MNSAGGGSRSSSRRSFRATPAFVSAAGFPKRYKGRAIFSERRLLAEWLRRPSVFLLALFCLLVAPPLWFVSRTDAPTPAFIAELEGERPRLPRASSQHQQTAKKIEDFPPIIEGTPRPREPAERVKSASGGVDINPSSLRVTHDELLAQPSDQRESLGHSERTSEAPVVTLPAEVFRDVPAQECLQSPLWRKRVDPSDYEFGCDDIYVSLTTHHVF